MTDDDDDADLRDAALELLAASGINILLKRGPKDCTAGFFVVLVRGTKGGLTVAPA